MNNIYSLTLDNPNFLYKANNLLDIPSTSQALRNLGFNNNVNVYASSSGTLSSYLCSDSNGSVILSGTLTSSSIGTTGALNVGGNIAVTGNSLVSGNSSISGTGTITGTLTIGSSYYISPTLNSTSFLSVKNGGSSSSVLQIAGTNGTSGVAGVLLSASQKYGLYTTSSNFLGKTGVGYDAGYLSAFNFSTSNFVYTCDTTGNFYTAGSLFVGNPTVGGFTLYADTIAPNTSTYVTIGNDVVIGTNIIRASNALAAITFDINANTTLQGLNCSNVTTTGNITTLGSATISGNITASGTATIAGRTIINNQLQVAGNFGVSSNASIAGSTTLGSLAVNSFTVDSSGIAYGPNLWRVIFNQSYFQVPSSTLLSGMLAGLSSLNPSSSATTYRFSVPFIYNGEKQIRFSCCFTCLNSPNPLINPMFNIATNVLGVLVSASGDQNMLFANISGGVGNINGSNNTLNGIILGGNVTYIWSLTAYNSMTVGNMYYFVYCDKKQTTNAGTYNMQGIEICIL